MPPRRMIKKARVKTQTFLEPYQFRPIPLSLAPADIEMDIEVMNTLLLAQRTALSRIAAQREAAAAAAYAAGHVAAADAMQQQYQYQQQYQGMHAGCAISEEDSEAPPSQPQHQQLQQLQQQQQQQQAYYAVPAQAAVQAQHPVLASPTCTFQHQQAFAHQQLAGYAIA